jgi:hypothetical protein
MQSRVHTSKAACSFAEAGCTCAEPGVYLHGWHSINIMCFQAGTAARHNPQHVVPELFNIIVDNLFLYVNICIGFFGTTTEQH